MGKKLLVLMTTLLLVFVAQGQHVGSKACPTCGKPMKECPYKGKHPQQTPKQNTGNKPSQAVSKPKPSKKPVLPEKEVTPPPTVQVPAKETATPAPEANSKIRMEGNDLVFISDGTEYRYRMVYVEGGTFTMGCTSEQGSDCYGDEKPVHSVTLSDYYIGQTEVTQALWKAVMGSNPSYWEGGNLPVESVSYNDVTEFVVKLNSKTGRRFRLPTEAEWEYAARGGKKSRGYKYSGGNNIGSVAWYDGNSGKTHPVAQKQANELGLYDMSGNVWESCADWYGSYSGSSQSNPQGPSSGSGRVSRGGGWFHGAGSCRVSNRSYDDPSYRIQFDGFRLVLSR